MTFCYNNIKFGRKMKFINKIAFLFTSLLFVAELASAQFIWDIEPLQERDRINKRIFAIEAEKPEVYQVQDRSISNGERSTPIRIYTPSAEDCPLPIILFIHGGAWVAGNLDTHDNLARYLCNQAKAVVVAVGYTNSPEGKFPLPLEQCYDALVWINENAFMLHGDKNRLAVVGDSAGGNLSAAVCLLARERKGPPIQLQVLINPLTDLTGNGTLQPQGDALDQVRWWVTQYVQDPNDVNSPYVSPFVAKDLSHLPPALIILAEKDALRDDGQKYANRLIAAGIPTNVYTQWNIGHLAGNGARASQQARESLDVAVAVLRGTFLINR